MDFDFTATFKGGKTVRTVYGEATVEVHDPGPLVCPTGRLVACDPLVFPETPAFKVRVAPGKYPVRLNVLRFDKDQRVGCAMVRFQNRKPDTWAMALVSGQRLKDLKEDEAFGYPVDSGTGCFMDATAAKRLRKEMKKDPDYFEQILKKFDETYVDTWSWTNMTMDPASGANLVAFSSGVGDGFYTSYFGYREQEPVCLVTDFGLLAIPGVD